MNGLVQDSSQMNFSPLPCLVSAILLRKVHILLWRLLSLRGVNSMILEHLISSMHKVSILGLYTSFNSHDRPTSKTGHQKKNINLHPWWLDQNPGISLSDSIALFLGFLHSSHVAMHSTPFFSSVQRLL